MPVDEKLTLSNLTAGTHILFANYTGDSNHASACVKVTIVVNTNKTIIIASDMIRGYNSGLDYQIKVVDINGKPISDKNVEITINGKVYSVKTDSDGVGKLNAGLGVGTYNVVVHY